ncbi:MAG TPA: hypothetical protein VGM75_35505 [Pseudonocardiaceae bacterium]
MTAPQRGELRIETGYLGHSATTSFFIDDVDFFQLQRRRKRVPLLRRDGIARSDTWWKVYQPTDPVGLLPPDSRVLLPSAAPNRAVTPSGFRCVGMVWWEPHRARRLREEQDSLFGFALANSNRLLDAQAWSQPPPGAGAGRVDR